MTISYSIIINTRPTCKLLLPTVHKFYLSILLSQAPLDTDVPLSSALNSIRFSDTLSLRRQEELSPPSLSDAIHNQSPESDQNGISDAQSLVTSNRWVRSILMCLGHVYVLVKCCVKGNLLSQRLVDVLKL